MRKTITKVETTTHTEYCCDYCEKESYSVLCYLCGRDICNSHTIYSDYHVETGESSSSSDYPDKICPECREIFKQYLDKYNEINSKRNEELDSTYQLLKKECIENRNTKEKAEINNG